VRRHSRGRSHADGRATTSASAPTLEALLERLSTRGLPPGGKDEALSELHVAWHYTGSTATLAAALLPLVGW